MKIAIFTNNYLPNQYGVSGSIESFRKQFEKMGHTVYIFAPKYKKYYDDNKNVFRFPSLDIKYKIKFPLPIFSSKKIQKKIEEIDFDIIHSQHPNLLGKRAMRWAKKKKIPIVFTWHTLYDQYTHYIPLIPKKIATRWAIKNAVNYANEVDQIVVPTKSVKKIIKNWGVKNRRIDNVSTGVDEKKFQNTNGDKLREKLKIPKNKKIILSISRLTKEKNVEFLLETTIKILQKNPEAVFIFGGDGFLKDKLEKRVKESGLEGRIWFSGLIDSWEVKNYLSIADIFVYASMSETQGMIISEAMYTGLPIVAVKATGIKNLIQNNQSGLLSANDEDEFFEIVNSLLANDKLQEKLSFNAKKIANKEYTSKACARKMLKIYNKVILDYNFHRKELI
ncbi:MAG TPA: glycosyltransferase family 4 protein [Candidatus Moranbacteria bacterium]|nr:glycosyltransferase family 4 protein [Candidatus Moranbacteria bacterium]